MKSADFNSAQEAPPIILQAERVRRRIATSDAVASLVAELCFGPTHRNDLASLACATTARVAAATGAL